MHNKIDFTVVVRILLITFSPMIVGFATLFYIKSRQTKEILKTPKGNFSRDFWIKVIKENEN